MPVGPPAQQELEFQAKGVTDVDSKRPRLRGTCRRRGRFESTSVTPCSSAQESACVQGGANPGKSPRRRISEVEAGAYSRPLTAATPGGDRSHRRGLVRGPVFDV
jgi:hypothetical protein